MQRLSYTSLLFISSLNADLIRSDHFRFSSIFIKKDNQTEIFFLKKKTETEPKPGQTDRFRFGSVFLGQKPVQTGLAWFFRFWLGFLGFGSVFSGLARFFFRFFVGFGSVRFGFFGFLFIKPKPNRTSRFFQKFNRFNWFFFCLVFSVIFFLIFSV